MKQKLCPQCKIGRFMVKNENNDFVVVIVNENNDVLPIHPEDSLDGYDLETIYCLGCSWKGTVNKLI